MDYRPFEPGPYEVELRTERLVDGHRDGRVLITDVWSPKKAPVELPLIVYSHTSNGQRRQSTYLLRHLASHGYVVAAADHAGNTLEEAQQRWATGVEWSAEERDAYIAGIIADRVPDVRFLMDQFGRGTEIGLVGWSFGGWAVLATLEVDPRPAAVVALAPGGSSKPLPGIIPAQLTFAWQRAAPTLYLVAESDQYTPVDGQVELFERTPADKRMFILPHADHGHFADEIEDPGECSVEAAQAFTRALTLAHLDAVIKGTGTAEHFLDDAVGQLSQHGVTAQAFTLTADA